MLFPINTPTMFGPITWYSIHEQSSTRMFCTKQLLRGEQEKKKAICVTQPRQQEEKVWQFWFEYIHLSVDSRKASRLNDRVNKITLKTWEPDLSQFYMLLLSAGTVCHRKNIWWWNLVESFLFDVDVLILIFWLVQALFWCVKNVYWKKVCWQKHIVPLNIFFNECLCFFESTNKYDWCIFKLISFSKMLWRI